jgi:hypothetical protein
MRVLFLIALLSLASCKGKKEPNPEPGPNPKPKTFTVNGQHIVVTGAVK